MVLILENIHKSYGKRNIVNRVNLQVFPGEIVGLLGPNGAGKTQSVALTEALNQLRLCNAPVLGIAVNKVVNKN